MKKVFSIVLAVMMLATIAFATDTLYRVAPGAELTYVLGSSGGLTPDGTDAYDNTGTAVAIPIVQTTTSTVAAGSKLFEKDLTTKNYSITTVKWTKGSALVKSLTLNDDSEVVLTLKQDYTAKADITLATPKGKLLEGTFKITEKGTSKYSNYAIGVAASGNQDVIYVGYAEVEFKLNDTSETIDVAGGTIYNIKKGTESYATLSFSDKLGNDVNVRVYDGDKLFLNSSTSPNLDIVKKYSDLDPELQFIKFSAAPTFSSTATYYIYADEDEFVYEIKNGSVVASGAKWSDDDGCWIIKTRTLGAYVISDVKLPASTTSTDTGTDNPDTGANDIVGIATALAAVALISAAAISLKK